MEDTLSINSTDSTTLTEEYEFITPIVHTLPQLKIPNNCDLETLLSEVLAEIDIMEPSPGPPLTSDDINITFVNKTSTVSSPVIHKDLNNEENDSGKISPVDELPPIGDVFQDCTRFDGISYLGAAKIDAPKSKSEIQRNMKILNEQLPDHLIKLSVGIPSCSDGSVVLYDALTGQVMARYEINRILFFSHGILESPEASCFAFTLSHGDTQESSIFQCHVFRCDIPEAVRQVDACFTKAFQRVPKSLTTSINEESISDDLDINNKGNNMHMFVFEVSMEILEDDGKGRFNPVPRDQSSFKIRSNIDKRITLNVQQVVAQHDHNLIVERCFGVLLSPGRHVKHSDMQLLEMIKTKSDVVSDEKDHIVTAEWDPKEPAFEILNNESRDSRVYITVAMDLVIRGIRDPVRLLLESSVKVHAQNDRFWSIYNRRPHIQQFYVNLKEVNVGDLNETTYKVINVESSGELDRSRLNLTLNNIAKFIRSPSVTSMEPELLTPKEEDCPSDGDEPLLSGTGNVSKEVTENELLSWKEVLDKWPSSSLAAHPRQLPALVRQGIPEALRGEVWLRLAGCDADSSMMETYKLLIAKECSYENVIKRDINRTFPAHDQFKNPGNGQENLSRISRAYAVYDTEVGYCQGLSFLAATLLLHMPEEQTFCVLVKLMYDYGLRDLYKTGFECLYLRLYQLNRLMEEHVQQLSKHFLERGVESHMFASQWFLTLFTARFPLYFVFNIIDVFLLQGMDTLFQVAIALLMIFKKDLLQLDFENILKYFRVTLPKKCRNEEVARQVIKLACSLKMKKLKKYEQEFIALKEVQDNADKCTTELENIKYMLQRSEEEKKRLEDELLQVKEMLKREVQKAESDLNKNKAIISEYKTINKRLEIERTNAKTTLNQIRAKISNCDKCKVYALEDFSTNSSGNEKIEEQDHNIQSEGRIKELEVQLAQTKLAQVEAECRNQDLTHKLANALTELSTTKNSWPPWFHKTLSSIKEVTANKAALQNHRRDSAPADSIPRDETTF